MVKRLDVISRLSDHQTNLLPASRQSGAVLLALPTPPICLALAPLLFQRLRAQWLAEMAEELGGGDGPLPIVDLDTDSVGVPARLDELAERGIRQIHLHGAIDQPGFARAVQFRWIGDIRSVRADARGRHSLLYALMDDPAPVVWLSQDTVRLRPGERVIGEPRLVLVACWDFEGCSARTSGSHQVLPYALDPGRLSAPWSGFLPPSALWSTARGEDALQRACSIWESLGFAEAPRNASLGLDPSLERALRSPQEESLVPQRPEPSARLVAVTGIDGSGKSTQIQILCDRLQGQGVRTRVLKLYRQGAFLELANELAARTRRGAPRAAFRLSRIVKLVDSLRVHRDELEPTLQNADVVVMDRYVETHLAAAESQLGWDLARHPLLEIFPDVDVCFWLMLPPEEALERLCARGEPLSADEHLAGLEGYARCFERMANVRGELLLDARDAVDVLAARIFQSLPHQALGLPSGIRTARRTTPPSLRPSDQVSCRVWWSPRAGRTELGESIFGLRRHLSDRVGACAVAESLWLEAYSAQVLLDLQTLAPAEAWVRLWPGTLARMRGLGDLLMLDELDRMLLPVTEVSGEAEPDREFIEEAFARLGAAPAAARRLARDYLRASRELADERGWIFPDVEAGARR